MFEHLVRLVEQGDLTQCAEVFVEVFGSAPWNEDWELVNALARLEELYRTPGFYGVIARDDAEVPATDLRQVLGFAMGHTEPWRRGKHFYLKEMCVVPDQQRRGIGTVMIQALCRDLAKMGVDGAYLTTRRDSPAQAFYEKCGFGTNPNMILMGKHLPSCPDSGEKADDV